MEKQVKQPTIQLTEISLRKGYSEKDGLIGTATFRNKRDDYGHSEGVTINIKLDAAQVGRIIEVCGDSLKTEAKRQAQAFYENAAAATGNLLENKSDE